MLQFGANLMKFDQQIKYLGRGAVRAGNYSLNFRLGPGNTHLRRAKFRLSLRCGFSRTTILYYFTVYVDLTVNTEFIINVSGF